MNDNNMDVEEEWTYSGNNPTWKTNYLCKINKNGLWRIESDKFHKRIGGKWLLRLELKPNSPAYPTMADQNNIMSGLLEVDWHNDTFKFEDGSTRCSSFGHPPTFEFLKRLRIFEETLKVYKIKYNGQTKLTSFDEDD